MRNYCRAYYLKDMRQFPFWSESYQENEALTEDTVVYLWDDFTVIKSPSLADQGVLWEHVTPEWEIFCKETLQFEIPEDLRYAYEQEAQEQRATDASKTMDDKSVSSGKGE